MRMQKEKNWAREDMEKAVAEAGSKVKSLQQAAKDNNVPFSTLRRRVERMRRGEAGEVKKGGRTLLPEHVERKLVAWILEMADKGLGVSKAEVGMKVREMVDTSGANHPFREGVPGRKWWNLFLARWPQLAERKAQTLDKGRAMALNAEALNGFFVNVRQVVEEHDLGPADIYNCDETSFVAAVTEGGFKVLCLRGAKRVYRRGASYRENITYMETVCADGSRLPGYFIFKGSRFSENYIVNCEEGAAMSVQENGWIDQDLAVGFLDHMRKHLGPGKKLLILDPHATHVNQRFVDRCKFPYAFSYL